MVPLLNKLILLRDNEKHDGKWPLWEIDIHDHFDAIQIIADYCDEHEIDYNLQLFQTAEKLEQYIQQQIENDQNTIWFGIKGD